MNENKSPEDNRIVKILSFILVLSLAGNAIFYINRTKTFPGKKELLNQNISLENQLNKTRNELNSFKGVSINIDEIITDAEKKIADKEKQIEVLRRDKNFKDKKNQILIHELDSLSEKYLDVIDSLLVERNKSRIINLKLESLEDIIANLNTKLGKASIITGDNIKVTPTKTANNGTSKITAIARKTDKIEVCIDLLANGLAKRGLTDVFFVVTSPEAKVIKGSNTNDLFFDHPDYKKQSECSSIESINYKNEKVNICTSIVIPETLKPGLYIVEAFTKDCKIGTTTFSLK